jgi:hypothetical protein
MNAFPRLLEVVESWTARISAVSSRLVSHAVSSWGVADSGAAPSSPGTSEGLPVLTMRWALTLSAIGHNVVYGLGRAEVDDATREGLALMHLSPMCS